VLGDSMAMPVGSMLQHFRTEFEEHMEAARERRDIAGLQPMGAQELGAVAGSGAA
jgi:NADH-quinone oxidoreductase subunit F